MEAENAQLKNENQFYLRKMKKMRKKMKEMEEELEEKDAHWNDFLNGAFGDELYPLTPSPEPDEFVKKVKQMEEENKRLRGEIKAYEKDALNSGQIALRQEQEIKDLKLELKAAQEVSVVYMKRYEQKAKEERQIDEIVGRIKCKDTFGHLIGKVPH